MKMVSLNLKKVIPISVVFAAYFLTAKFGLSFDAVGGFAALVWPPTGIAIAAVFLWGYEMGIGVALGAFLVNLSAGASLAGATGIMIGNTLEAIAAVYLLRKFGFDSRMQKLSDSLKFIALGAITATTVSATIGVGSLLITSNLSGAGLAITWLSWWVGDMLGALIIAPLIWAWSQPAFTKLDLRANIEGFFLGILTIAINVFIFTDLFRSNGVGIHFVYLLLLPIIWAAARFRMTASTLANLVTLIIAVGGTAYGNGPFVGSSLSESLLHLQAFMFSVSITALVLASSTSELSSARAKYAKLSEHLEEEVKERTNGLNEAQRIAHLGSWEWNVPEDKISWSDELYRIFGTDPGSFKADYGSFVNFLHPGDKERINAIIADSLKNKLPFDFEHRIVRADTSIRVLHAKGEVVTDWNGRVIKMRGTAQDITEIRKAERELVEKNTELERINKFMIDRELKMAELKKALKSTGDKNIE